MPFAKTDDRVRIYYEVHGRGTPLALAYGIGGNTGMWDVNRGALAARHRLILWEPRGHARSGSPDDPAKIRGSKLVVFSPASHFSNRDQPEVWNRTVLEFLAWCDRRGRG